MTGRESESLDVTCRVVDVIDGPWLKLSPCRLGPVPPTLPTPAWYVLVEAEGTRRRRIDVYRPEAATSVRSVALSWLDWVVVGYCNLLFLVPLSEGEIVEVPLAEGGSFDYLSDFRVGSDYLLAATGEGLLRIGPDGSVSWRNLKLGLDGVEISGIENGIIYGRGNWDPPDGWEDFAVSLSTGEPVEKRQSGELP